MKSVVIGRCFFPHACVFLLQRDFPLKKKLQDPRFAPAVQIAHSPCLGYWLNEVKIALLHPEGRRDFSVGQGVQARTGAHTSSYILRARTSFPDVKRPNIGLTTFFHLVPDLL